MNMAELVMLDENGDQIKQDPLLDLVLNPNDLQTYIEFDKDLVRNVLMGGYSYIVPKSTQDKNRPKSFIAGGNKLFILNTDNIHFDDYNDVSIFDEDIIFEYSDYKYMDIPMKYSSIIPIYDTQDPNFKFKGVSRIKSLEKELKSQRTSDFAIENQMDSSGALVVSPRQRGANVMDEGLSQVIMPTFEGMKTHKEDIEAVLNNLGMGKGKRIAVAGKEVTITNLAESLAEYDFYKYKKESGKIIYNLYQIPKEFQNLEDSSATYTNREMAFRELVEIVVKPICENKARTLSSVYNESNNRNVSFFYDFSKLKAYFKEKQEAEIFEQDKYLKILEHLLILRDRNLITERELKLKLKSYGLLG